MNIPDAYAAKAFVDTNPIVLFAVHQIYLEDDFSSFLGVTRQTIQNSTLGVDYSRLLIHVPRPIKNGDEAIRWSYKQIRDYQIQPTELSGVELKESESEDVGGVQ